MSEQEIRDLIQQVIDENSTSNQFAVSDTPFHTHNGSDSQSLKFTRLFDVPSSYYGKAGKSLVVNSTENALVFGSGGYSGSVASGGTSVNLPTGWTCSNTGAGAYRVTHNLGTANYNLVCMAGGSQFGVFSIYAKTTTYFDVSTISMASALTNCAFDFILIPY